MYLSLMLFLTGLLGFVLNSSNMMLMLISMEMMLLSVTFLMLINSLNFDDMLGQVYAMYMMAMAGAESAMGLGMLVAFYSLSGSVSMEAF